MFESPLKRLCLDTNVYIIGTQEANSEEAQILSAIGYYGKEYQIINAEIVLSAELIDRIRRVGKYLWNKDKAGLVLGMIWSRLNTHYITPNSQWHKLYQEMLLTGHIPREDLEIYLTAKYGNTDCFVSSNRELIKAIAEFECLTPDLFIQKYLN